MINKWIQLKKISMKEKRYSYFIHLNYTSKYNEINLEYLHYRNLKGGILLRNVFKGLKFSGDKLKKDDIIFEINKKPINYKGDIGKDILERNMISMITLHLYQ